MKCFKCNEYIRATGKAPNKGPILNYCKTCYINLGSPPLPIDKKCSKCKQNKPVGKFSLIHGPYIENNNVDIEYSSICKDCMKETSKKHRTTINARYKRLYHQAQRRGISVSISKEEFAHLISLPCTYCGSPASNEEQGIHLDRLNNDLGYVLDNVVPCCGACNMMRQNHYTSDEFKVLRAVLTKIRQSPEALKSYFKKERLP
jgi:hypothetical protein